MYFIGANIYRSVCSSWQTPMEPYLPHLPFDNEPKSILDTITLYKFHLNGVFLQTSRWEENFSPGMEWKYNFPQTSTGMLNVTQLS